MSEANKQVALHFLNAMSNADAAAQEDAELDRVQRLRVAEQRQRGVAVGDRREGGVAGGDASSLGVGRQRLLGMHAEKELQLGGRAQRALEDDGLREQPERFQIVLRNLTGASFAGSNGKPDTSVKVLTTEATIVDNAQVPEDPISPQPMMMEPRSSVESVTTVPLLEADTPVAARLSDRKSVV